MSAQRFVARAGALGLTAEQVRALARHVGLPESTPVEEVAAEINGKPIAASHANRAVKRDRVIERELEAAVADGRIPRSAIARWRSVMASRGADGIAELRALQSPTAIMATAKAAGILALANQASTRTPIQPPIRTSQGAPVAASAPTDAVVSDPASGALSWRGLPVTAGSDGTPLVHTRAGAVSIDAFKAAGLDVETERAAIAMGRLTGTAAKAGVPSVNPLFRGGA